MKKLTEMSAQELVAIIVGNNVNAVKAQILKYTGLNVAAYSPAAVVEYVMKMYNNGYNVSPLLSVPVINPRTTLIGLGYTIDQLPDVQTPTGTAKLGDDTEGNDWGSFLTGIAGVLTAGGVLGTLFAPGTGNTNNTTLPNAQNITPVVPSDSISIFGAIVKKSTAWGVGIGLVVVTVLIIFRKKIFGKKAAA